MAAEELKLYEKIKNEIGTFYLEKFTRCFSTKRNKDKVVQTANRLVVKGYLSKNKVNGKRYSEYAVI